MFRGPRNKVWRSATLENRIPFSSSWSIWSLLSISYHAFTYKSSLSLLILSILRLLSEAVEKQYDLILIIAVCKIFFSCLLETFWLEHILAAIICERDARSAHIYSKITMTCCLSPFDPTWCAFTYLLSLSCGHYIS